MMNELYRFHNSNASSVRNLIVANCVESDVDPRLNVSKKGKLDTTQSNQASQESRDVHTGNPLSNLPLEQELLDKGATASTSQGNLQGGFQTWKPFENVSDISYSNDYCVGTINSERGSSSHSANDGSEKSASSPVSDMDSTENSLDDVLEPNETGDDRDGAAKNAGHRLRPQKRNRDQRGKLK